MPTKKLFIFAAISFLIIGSAVFTAKISAQETNGIAGIQYPVAELGNCQDKTACKAYCDKSENIEACLSFAEKNNLMSKEEVATAKKFTATNIKKPGRCTTKDSCEEYCNDINHIDECITFATENNLIPPKELEEAKKVQAAIKKGIKPPACGNKKACDTYCDSPEHMEECINFAMEAGFMSDQEKTDSQKMLAAVKRGIKPPPCKGKEACDEYCGDPSNMETCMTFAMEAGFMSEQEKTDSQKMLVALKKGVKPPNCKGKEACDVYCQQDEHFEECLNFAETAGFMSAEEATMSRKTGGKGPGGCKGKDECDAFCNNSANQETCFNFAKDNGMISEKDLKNMEEGKQQFKQSLSQAPQTVLDCLNSQMGSDMLEKLKSGELMPPKEIGDKMRICFEQEMGSPKPGQPGEGGMIPPAGQTGPGGCKTLEECKSYCESNPQECQNFQGPNGPQTPNGQQGQNGPQGPNGQPMQAGPGGCKTPEECQLFCASNPQECQNFKAPMPPTPGSPGSTGQGGPAGGSGGGMGISNEELEKFIQTQPVCQNPEQCQQLQQQIEQQVQQQIQGQTQQIQNQMTPPQPCQGEGCNYGPPPNLSGGGGQMPQPSTGGSPSPMMPPPPSGSTSGGGPMPAGQYPNQPQPPQPIQQPQQYQQPPQQPAPGGTAPAPSGFLAPQNFVGSIISAFDQALRAEK